MQDQDVKALLDSLSLEEKIGQLVQLPAQFQNEEMATGPMAQMGLTQEDVLLAGSYLSVIGAKKLRPVQERFMARHPHHIPLLFMADIINGYRTAFPIPLAQSCAFDPALVEECASIAAKETAAAGVHVTFSPMADLCRDARWGRVMEGGGEDPFLSGQTAAAMVRGYQGKNIGEKGRIAACLKHFAGYGAPEGGRDYNTVELSERTLREDYLPAYQAAVDAGCALVMPSFNTLDRVPSAANEWLLKDVLRGEMGFSGMVISDWSAVAELIPHGVARDEREAAFLALRAGVDMDMASPVYIKNLKALVEAGMVPVQWVDEAALRVLTLKNKLGLFENPYKDLDEKEEEALVLCPAHRQAARECAEKTFVLLKNEDGLLPLNAPEKTAWIGPYVHSKELKGAWSIFARDEDALSIKEALSFHEKTKAAPTAPGCNIADPDCPVMGFMAPVQETEVDGEEALKEAVRLAKQAETVVLALGEHRECTGEAASRGELTLPKCQLRLLDEVSRVNPNVAVLLFTGRPLDIRAVRKKARAILLCWLPGTEGAEAAVRTVLGESSPSGRLSMAFPYCVGQLPLHYNHLRTGRPYAGDHKASRFGSKYQDIPNEPLYPFGFGLSYTAFAYGPVTLSKNEMKKGDGLTASVTVTNVGKRPGTETAQMYISDDFASVARPVRALKGFQKVTLRPGESREISFAIDESMLRFWDIGMTYTSEPGDFHVFIGPDCRTENGASFTLR